MPAPRLAAEAQPLHVGEAGRALDVGQDPRRGLEQAAELGPR